VIVDLQRWRKNKKRDPKRWGYPIGGSEISQYDDKPVLQ
jgi:hypothetical protein